MTEKKIAVMGMDLGGSNLFSVVYDYSTREILFEEKIDTEAKKGYQHVLTNIANQIEKFKQIVERMGYELYSIGLGIPGILNLHKGIVTIAPNLGWKNANIIKDLGIPEEIKSRIVLMNDVNAGMYGELIHMAKLPEIAVAYFCGTGVGGAIAINGRIITGVDGSAGEVGHMVIKKNGKKCLCGRKGCLEVYIGKWALNAKIQKVLEKNDTLLKDIIKYDLTKTPIKSASLKKAYLQGDKFTRKLLEKYYASYLGVAISQVVNFINPDVVILGGGIMEALGEFLLPYIYKYIERYSITMPPTIFLAQLGDYAGPIGAAYYSFEHIKNNQT